MSQQFRRGFRLMGIVNVTPDSFSDGGRFYDASAAVEHGLELVGEGADILDVGGESTRPGAEPVSVEEELRRIVPVVERLAAAAPRTAAGEPVQISIDTSKAAVAHAALEAGASFVNDVTALRGDPEMADVVAQTGAQCCLMHMLGEPRTMQADPRYGDVVDDVKAFLDERLRYATDARIAPERIVLDPGIGFGKTVAHNLELLRRLDELLTLGQPLLVGTSRKSFIGRIATVASDGAGAGEGVAATGTRTAAELDSRLPGTIATNVMALERGASIFRVHDVAPVAGALKVAAATLGSTWTAQSAPTTTMPTG